MDSLAFNGVTEELKELYLYNNDIASFDVSTFRGMTGLRELWIENNDRIGKLNFGCSHLCDVPTNCDIKASNYTMLCGTSCAASSLGIEHPIRFEDFGDVCEYGSCVSWDLSAAGSRGGWWVPVFGAVMASLALLATDLL